MKYNIVSIGSLGRNEKSVFTSSSLPIVKLSFGFVFAALFTFFLSAHLVSAASLYFSPQSVTRFAGNSFSVGIYVSSADTAMNAAQGAISFPNDKLEVISLSKNSSIINLWVQEPSFSNRDGAINFEGVVTNPGFQSSSGKILTVTFRAKDTGKASLSFLSGSVLANDGKGTNILNSLGRSIITLTEAPSAEAPPAPKSEKPVDLPAAVIDVTPPEQFIIIRQDEDLTSSQPVFSWASFDKTSSIAYYEAKIGNGDWFNPEIIKKNGLYVLPLQSPVDLRTLVVRAYDKAGNLRESSIEFKVLAKNTWYLWWYKVIEFLSRWRWFLILIVILLVTALYFLTHRSFKRRKKSKQELQEFKAELQRDLKRLEKNLETEEEKGLKVDLSPSHIQKARESLQKEVKHIEEDIKKEIKEIDDFPE